jgi:hypothetical protein
MTYGAGLVLALVLAGCCSPSETLISWKEVPIFVEPLQVEGLPVNTPGPAHNAQVDSLLAAWERDIASRENRPLEQVRRREYQARRITELGDTASVRFVLDREPYFDIAVRYGPRKAGYRDTTVFTSGVTKAEKWGYYAWGAGMLLAAEIIIFIVLYAVKFFRGLR